MSISLFSALFLIIVFLASFLRHYSYVLIQDLDFHLRNKLKLMDFSSIKALEILKKAYKV